MKYILHIIMIGAIYSSCSCSKEEILTYNNNTSERFIHFEKSEADSIGYIVLHLSGRNRDLFPGCCGKLRFQQPKRRIQNCCDGRIHNRRTFRL